MSKPDHPILQDIINGEDLRTMQELCQEALVIQDACNATAVAGSMNRAMKRMLRMGMDTDAVNQHPVTCVYLSKLLHLAVLPQPNLAESFENVRRIANLEQE